MKVWGRKASRVGPTGRELRMAGVQGCVGSGGG